MHDHILIQSTQLFCKAMASYPSGGFWVSRYLPLNQIISLVTIRIPRPSMAAPALSNKKKTNN